MGDKIYSINSKKIILNRQLILFDPGCFYLYIFSQKISKIKLKGEDQWRKIDFNKIESLYFGIVSNSKTLKKLINDNKAKRQIGVDVIMSAPKFSYEHQYKDSCWDYYEFYKRNEIEYRELISEMMPNKKDLSVERVVFTDLDSLLKNQVKKCNAVGSKSIEIKSNDKNVYNYNIVRFSNREVLSQTPKQKCKNKK